jgi:hypothetical protein
MDMKASSGVGLVRIICINGETRLSSHALIVSKISCSRIVLPFRKSDSESDEALALAFATG